MKKYLIACDIGNTNITVGLFYGARLISKARLAVGDAFKFGYFLKNNFISKKVDLEQIEALVICSVVPEALRSLRSSLGKLKFRLPIYVVGKDLFVPIVNRYLKPDEVGQDRLVGVYAGIILYGAPLVVVDFGTAVTFDLVSQRKEYLGGMIFPGLEISLKALSEKTALLPKVELKKPKGFIGRDTESSILNGVVFGYASLTENLTAKIKQKIGKNSKVIGTGGDINLIASYCKTIDKIDRDLLLKGLFLVYQNSRRVL